jgi:hypothetical protein
MEGQGDSRSHPLFIEMSHKSLAPEDEGFFDIAIV